MLQIGVLFCADMLGIDQIIDEHMLQIGVLFCADMLKIVQIIDKHRGKVVQRPFINFQYIYIFILRKKNFFSW